MALPLQGQVAIVTGGGRGIGRVIARTLAENGFAVCICGRSPESLADAKAELEALGVGVVTAAADVRNAEDVEQVVELAETKLGPVTLLVNNAGVGGVPAAIWNSNPEEWWHAVEVNLRGPYLFSRAVLQRMVPRGAGRIVDLNSGAGVVPFAFNSDYGVSKAALLRLNETMAEELTATGVHVFSVSPGRVETDMTDGIDDQIAEVNPAWQPIPPVMIFPPEAVAKLIVTIASGKLDRLNGRLLSVLDDTEALLRDAEKIVEEGHRILKMER